MNPQLINVLVNDDKIQPLFFTKINDLFVFDKQKFLFVIESNEFLPNSFTNYKNKIGLINNKTNSFINNQNDVVLSFPFKDCVLEGGQSRDDQKCNEIMYNEIIAANKISNMLAPKILTNAKRYSKDGIEIDIEFSEHDNLIIKGNNLIALASILNRYENKIKCIYIDPPYNTGNDSFNYNDKFNHSTWLVFMKNRLELAKKLLRDDGVIFVQCDDNEQAYLKVLMDEVFGRENFSTTLHVELSTTQGMKVGAAQKGQIVKNGEYILIYHKNYNLKFFTNLIFDSKSWDSHYSIYIDPITNKRTSLLNFIKENTKYKDITKEKIEELYEFDDDFRSLIHNHSNNIFQDAMIDIKFNLSEEDNFKLKNNEIIKFKDYLIFKTSTNVIRQLLPLEKAIGPTDDFDSKFGLRKIRGNWWPNFYKDMMNINKEANFVWKSGKKPERLIKDIIKLSTKQNDIVLDFHLGSGTTCAVAHKMNRQYIGIEQMDYIENITIERLKKVIDGEQSGISKDVNWTGGGSFVYCELKEDSIELIRLIQNSNEQNIHKIKNLIFNDHRIIPYVSRDELQTNLQAFDTLKLLEQKQILLELVDKNKLYVNYVNIEDKNFNINKKDIKFNKSFYKQKR
ncbi:site-specific DNA-methyltransferase [Ureaplasma parvum]|nr:site-specific DNA-methyltransferase [Ureaplasma parvum]EDT48931.1 type III restriction-modification system methylation subunit [Ureaplasma parvum serovar 1 str. ATCC 27813]ASD25173.1 site-specific DNA-methyltransferase [Ureaplasma parvum]ASD28896.1 site-specific DNA-methyltransferase [Ureaplasma parvum]ASD29422.1 site-specific DNA-methyltransferase [Ureaplasma parvum]UIU28649.1 site-specific DNA-methyltransferase [Ureaplasma parvum]